MKKIILSGLFLLALPMASFAQVGPYAAAEIGGVMVSNGNEEVYNWSNNPTGLAGRVAIGYLWGSSPNLNYGVEAGALYFPNAQWHEHFSFEDVYVEEKLKLRGRAIDVLGVLKYSSYGGFIVFLKGGLAHLHTEASVIASNDLGDYYDIDLSGSKVVPEVGIGFGYQVTPKTEVDFTYSTLLAGKFSDNNAVTRTQTAMVGFVYSFG